MPPHGIKFKTLSHSKASVNRSFCESTSKAIKLSASNRHRQSPNNSKSFFYSFSSKNLENPLNRDVNLSISGLKQSTLMQQRCEIVDSECHNASDRIKMYSSNLKVGFEYFRNNDFDVAKERKSCLQSSHSQIARLLR